ncbi:MAG: hypothetical protein HXX09_14155 [Bacteroidetes bacterium]|nr:hypothetical protein [Bacteroidota bacterium]
MKKLLIVSLFLIVLFGCRSNKKPDDAVAKVYDEYLYKIDLVGIVPKGTSSKDSAQIINSYINNWVNQKLLLKKAEKNLDKKQIDFEKQLNDYKNSLIIYAYEQELIKQKLDTVISDKEIATYYQKNQNDFQLRDNIIKVIFVKLPLKSQIENKVKALYKSESEADRKTLITICKKDAINCFFEDNSWLFFSDLLKEIPIKTYNQEEYLQNHRYVEMQDSLYSYYVNIKGFKIKEGISPLSFEKENIKNIIINKRKLKLIEEMRNETFKEAIKKGDFKIY